jgi:hypothetical protein
MKAFVMVCLLGMAAAAFSVVALIALGEAARSTPGGAEVAAAPRTTPADPGAPQQLAAVMRVLLEGRTHVLARRLDDPGGKAESARARSTW